LKKLVLTGAAGRLGSYLREPLTKLADELVSTDIAEDIGTLYPRESYVQADLADLDAMIDVLKGADMVVHFGAIGDEAPFEEILGPNIIGAHNVWEAAFRNGVKRVVYASSVHTVGMHKIADNIGLDAPDRPDTFYGLAKCFAEDLGRMYWDKRGVESVHMRIFSCAQVVAPRSLSTWLSYDDLIRMVTAAITAQTVGFSIVYGISNNDRAPVHNTGAGHIGYKPQDNAEQFAEAILSDAPPADPTDLAQMTIGGPFATIPLGESGLAKMTIVDDAKKT
jgi:uronate dehydrogenase